MFLTICTPTYNRAYTLERVYKSLIAQTFKDFEWVIIDDGSNDNTSKIVKTFIEEGKIKIHYIYQTNQGKHIALNKGMEIAKGELFTCLDSDDWLYQNAIENVNSTWQIVRGNNNIVGIISLDSFENGKIVGSKFPQKLRQVNWIDLNFNYKVTGDKDYYFRRDEIRKIKFPSFKDNKHMPPTYQHYLLSKKFDFYLLNIPTKFVEYLEDGISKNKFNKYVIAPDNFAKYRFEIMDSIPTFKRKLINAIHFNSSLYLGKVKLKPRNIQNKIIVFLTKPFGYLLSFYIKRKVYKSNESHKV